MTDRNGKPLFLRMNYIAQGSPYFDEEYRISEITVANGTVYHNVWARLNLAEFQVEYLTNEGKVMVAIVPIKKIKLINSIDEDGKLRNITLANYDQGLNSPDSKIYEVIDSGKITLLKKVSVSYRDEKKYGEASITRIFAKKEVDYALATTGEFIKMEKGKAFVVELLKDKKEEVTAFIDKLNLGCKTSKDWQVIFQYYNSL